MTRPATALAAAALTTLLAACGTATADTQQPAADASAPAEPEGTTLVIGSVSDDPEEEAEVFQPFIDHVADRLGDAGVSGGDVVVAESVEEMAELLRTGAVDIYVDNMNGVTQVVQDGAATPLLRRWKDGAPTYHSVVVARRDSGITTPEQLVGRTVAFEEETSTDGYFLPVSTLRQLGLTVSQVAEPTTAPAADEIGFVFSGDDENTVFLVLDGRVDAGALSEEDLAENAGSRADELVTVARSIDVPRHGVVARADLDPALARAVTTLFTGLHETAEGREVLEEFDDTARFDALTAADLAPVLDLRRFLGDGTP
ncbi:phosphate/phosphite/phosphonate ABC transporter substrate-binding protein [Geodermatophilus sp. DSM 45219]|uniref:phosphate/phosphite/phosphonate ABC transporter substrate-binding protein n=1 Tax=Geodermatophilus sp. DSM 45219 TaxID=1881103 RepID=UPI00088A0C4E|nr:phosphate/phosphite/phosphonate ABC transporter substrate-binding protein [Geodermatophilus sp. DSM 45219]SDN98711.1 phosphonate transport system substrate-binding protein [Geodermatophilus sp. DSM 45219]